MKRNRKAAGFSLIELLTVLGILTLVMGVVFTQILTVQKRYKTEQNKLDMSQESREFLDQIVRDLHMSGYPNSKMFSAGVLMNPKENDSRNAVGLVRITATEVFFEGDVDGDGVVDSIRYSLDWTQNTGACPCRLRRSQIQKLNATAPLAQATNYATEVDFIVNSGGSGGAGPNGSRSITGNSTFVSATGTQSIQANDTVYAEYRSDPVFTAYDAAGVQMTLPLDIQNNPTQIASVRSISIRMNVLSPTPDPQTLMRPAVVMRAAARFNN